MHGTIMESSGSVFFLLSQITDVECFLIYVANAFKHAASHATIGAERPLLCYQNTHISSWTVWIVELAGTIQFLAHLYSQSLARKPLEALKLQWGLAMPPIPIGSALSKFLTNHIYLLSPHTLGVYFVKEMKLASCWNTEYNWYILNHGVVFHSIVNRISVLLLKLGILFLTQSWRCFSLHHDVVPDVQSSYYIIHQSS